MTDVRNMVLICFGFVIVGLLAWFWGFGDIVSAVFYLFSCIGAFILGTINNERG